MSLLYRHLEQLAFLFNGNSLDQRGAETRDEFAQDVSTAGISAGTAETPEPGAPDRRDINNLLHQFHDCAEGAGHSACLSVVIGCGKELHMLGSYVVAVFAMLLSGLSARTLIYTVGHFDAAAADSLSGH